MVGETLEMVVTSERDDGNLSVELRDLLVELPQLREMRLAVESTEIPEDNQDGRPPQEPARVEDLSLHCPEFEVKVDLQ